MVKEYFSHDIDALSDLKIVKMMNDYDFTGFGWYWAIVAELCRNGGRYEFSDIGIMAKCLGIKKESLSNFINKCIHNYTYKDSGLFNCDDKSFWSDSLNRRLEIRNKRRESAKRTDDTDDIKLDGIKLTKLTKKQYQNLVEKHGEERTLEAIKYFDKWLCLKGSSQKGYIGKNNYGHFRSDSWPWTGADEVLAKKNKSTQPNWSI